MISRPGITVGPAFFVVGMDLAGLADLWDLSHPTPGNGWRGRFACCKVVRYAVHRVKYPFLLSMPETILRGHRPHDLNSCKKANIFALIDVNI